MTPKQALEYISRYAPCPHNSADTKLGTGKIWAECQDCGATFLQENWDNARNAAKKFGEAIDILMALARNAAASKLPPCPFCGESELLKPVLLPTVMESPDPWMAIKCMTCGAQGPISKDGLAANDLWRKGNRQ